MSEVSYMADFQKFRKQVERQVNGNTTVARWRARQAARAAREMNVAARKQKIQIIQLGMPLSPVREEIKISDPNKPSVRKRRCQMG